MNILLTGCSKGVGLKTCELLLKHQHHVFGISRTFTQELSALKQTYGDNLQHLSYDLGNSEGVKQFIFQEFIGKIPIHGFVNNAAIAYDDIISNLNLAPLQAMYQLNVFTPFMITKGVIRNMILNRVEGSIVHLSSVSVHTGYKGLAMYASTKGALEGFSKGTSREWGEKGIRSNCLVAGFMETEMSASLSEDQKTRIYNRTALKKATSVDSVAEMILFLLSEKSKSITGQNIFVDSGTL
jgi:3-oxoacyl-[acyl-carrier protein] reductase